MITIHSDKINRLLRLSRYAPRFFRRISTKNIPDKITLMLERIIDENNDRNFEYLREVEMPGDAISKYLIEEDTAKKKIAHDIYRMKHVLFDYLNVLWATKEVVDSLRYRDADLITNDEKLPGGIGILFTCFSSGSNQVPIHCLTTPNPPSLSRKIAPIRASSISARIVSSPSRRRPFSPRPRRMNFLMRNLRATLAREKQVKIHSLPSVFIQ